MKKILLLLVFITGICNAQVKPKDVFDTARSGTVDQMKMLFNKNKDTINSISPMGFSPLILACYRGNTAVAEFLISNVKDINYNSSSGTALAAVSVKGNIPLAKLLLEHKADPNIADPIGMTPLMYAVQFENKELIRLLLKYTANTKQANDEGKTSLDYAAFTNNQEIINLLKN